jgi:hypothetical protein
MRWYQMRRHLFFLLLFLVTACEPTGAKFPADADMIAQWKNDKSRLLALANDCKTTADIYDLSSLYSDKVNTSSVRILTGCKLELPSAKQSDAYQLRYIARDTGKTQFLMATNQHEAQIGWLRLLNVIEEKGLLYIAQDNLSPFGGKFQTVGQKSVVNEPLDSLTGNYEVTTQAKIDNCEVWVFRPIEPHWYLYYHQNRNCMDRGL